MDFITACISVTENRCAHYLSSCLVYEQRVSLDQIPWKPEQWRATSPHPGFCWTYATLALTVPVNVLSLDTVTTAASGGSARDPELRDEWPGAISSYDKTHFETALFLVHVSSDCYSTCELPLPTPVLLFLCSRSFFLLIFTDITKKKKTLIKKHACLSGAAFLQGLYLIPKAVGIGY